MRVGDMVLVQTTLALAQFTVGVLVQNELGLVGVALMTAFVVGIRARHSGLAVTAAVIFIALLPQA
ncbi:hypothetical protein OG791_23440 [Streptomyces canus]|nr:hypothetical protein [Streptomyces canus]